MKQKNATITDPHTGNTQNAMKSYSSPMNPKNAIMSDIHTVKLRTP